MRSIQGLLFLGLALFALKWSFRIVEVMPGYTGMEPLPPFAEWEVYLTASLLALAGVWLIMTGELASLLGRQRASGAETFSAVISIFLGLFATKFSYFVPARPITLARAYPPFDPPALRALFLLAVLVGLYFFIKGELRFWRREAAVVRSGAPVNRP